MTLLRQICSTAWDLLLLGVLLALASTPFLPVFGDYTGVGAAAFGIVAGLGAACVSGSRSWGPAPTTAFVFGVHLAGGTIPGLDDARFFRGNAFEVRTQIGLVIATDIGDDRYERLHHVGGIQPATQPGFQDSDIHLLFGQPAEGHKDYSDRKSVV